MTKYPALWGYKCEIKAKDKTETRFIGKVFRDGDDLILYRKEPYATAYLRKWNAFSFDSRVRHRIEEDGITTIHYDDENGHLWITSLQIYKLLEVEGNHGEMPQLYVEKNCWFQREPYYEVGWTDDIREVT